METRDLVVIGGGQAGLATAFAAGKAGLDTVVLEASDLAAGSWPTYYESLELFSPARFSSLPGRPFPGEGERYPTRDEVIDYLVGYADWLGTDIRLNQRVEGLEVEDGHLIASTATGLRLRAPRVIAATGAFGSPNRPQFAGMDTYAGAILHSADYDRPEHFAGQRVIVVGAGNSAVQIAVELAEVAQVTLATRSQLSWKPQRPLGRDIHWWFKWSGYDSAPIGRWLGEHPVHIIDDGRYREAISRGRPDHRQMFDAFDTGGVRWSGGQREDVDAVILATGFRPHLPFLAGTGALGQDGTPLHRAGVSTALPGLGYVGLQHQRSFASATIRGVGRDAAHVLRRLQPAASTERARSSVACCPAPALP